jgi:hypothetical protein
MFFTGKTARPPRVSIVGRKMSAERTKTTKSTSCGDFLPDRASFRCFCSIIDYFDADRS